MFVGLGRDGVAPQICEINLGSFVKPQTKTHLHDNCRLCSLSSFPFGSSLFYRSCSVVVRATGGGGLLQVLLHYLGTELCGARLC
jgi:hypothetical protein